MYRRLEAFRPPPRDDGVLWEGRRIEEAPIGTPVESGLWAGLGGGVPLDPPETDPLDPQWRNFTTTDATLAAGDYRVVWIDSLGFEFASDPVTLTQNGMLPPSTYDVRGRSPLLRAKYPADADDPQVEADLRQFVIDATQLVASITCRVLDESMPANLVDLAFRAVTLKTEQIAMSSSQAQAEATALGKRLRSISAGPWSESYFSPGELVVKGGIPQLDPDARIAEALWALMTEECREQWLALATGVHAPAGAVSAFDYRLMGRGAGREFGPDGF